MADAGVFGTITALGSIYVNGLHIELPAGLVTSGLLDGTAVPLAVGQSVAVATARAGDGLHARKVVEILPLVGPVERVELLQRRMPRPSRQRSASARSLSAATTAAS